MSNTKSDRYNKCSINIDINYVLTPQTCASVIVEFIKLLAYQRLQIPYNFERLKYEVDKKTIKNNSEDYVKESWHSSVYFKTTSAALGILESIFKNIYCEFQKQKFPQEICILFGSNILCAKEMYRVLIPKSISEHYHENHLKDAKNSVRSVLRCLVLSEELQKFFFSPLTLTNMFVFIKKNIDSDNDVIREPLTSEFFLPIDSFSLPSKVTEIIINLECESVIEAKTNCCNQLKIFDDSLLKQSEVVSESNDYGSKSGCWFQANIHLKGFQACFVNGESVSDSWDK